MKWKAEIVELLSSSRERGARDLSKRVGIILTIILAVSIIAFVTWCFFQPSPYSGIMKESFENGFGEWTPDANVPLDPKNPGHLVEWNITRVTDVAHSGQYALKFFIDGNQDDGTIWMERKIRVRKNSQVQINITFEFYSESESSVTVAAVCAYAGIRSPASEEDFVILGPANEVADWKNYGYDAAFNTGSSEEAWVSIGITVRWETYLIYHIDDIEVEIK
jgi:hypothetical protein